jgi:hypothetical protein
MHQHRMKKDILAVALPKHAKEKKSSPHPHWKDNVSQI